MSKTNPINPRRGEVWDVILESNAGSETQHSQPAVVVSSDLVNDLVKRLVVLITPWEDRFSGITWIVSIKPTDGNGLANVSAADTMEIHGVNVNHFIRRRGRLSANDIEEIIAAFDAVVECK